jgi:hypothetical protein
MSRSLAEFRETFPDEASCARYLFDRRWPEGFTCGCGGTKYASLKSRAYTYECLGCRHQTSITAGTVMHRSQLLLRKWFFAAHLIAASEGTISAREIQARLRIAYQTASELKRKLQMTTIPVGSEPLLGRVEVAQMSINFKIYDRYFHREMPYETVVVIALELPEDEPAKPKLTPGRRFNRVRLGAVLNSSPALIEPFICEHVQPGAILLTEDLDSFLGLLDYGYDVRELGETPSHAQRLFSTLKDWLGAQVVRHSDEVAARLKSFVAETNWRVFFDKILQLALLQEPTSYWDNVGQENPRKGAETVRLRPRRRKTATGMREDGSGALARLPPDLTLDC